MRGAGIREVAPQDIKHIESNPYQIESNRIHIDHLFSAAFNDAHLDELQFQKFLHLVVAHHPEESGDDVGG